MKSSTTRNSFVRIAIFLGCAVCCALPMLAALGLGGIATAAIGSVTSESMAIVIGILVAVAASMIAISRIAKRRARAESCDIECKSDQSCCGPKRSA